jgi:hypothetical protein
MDRARSLAPLLIIAVLILGGGAPALAQSAPVALPVEPRPGSDVAGMATLTDLGGGKTRVEVRLSPAAGDHPMHVHEGLCTNPNPAPRYALTNVQNGVSMTAVEVAVADLTQAPMSINVHRSVQDMDTVIACADLALPALSGMAVLPAGGVPEPDGETSGRTIAALALLIMGGLGLFMRRLGRRDT